MTPTASGSSVARPRKKRSESSSRNGNAISSARPRSSPTVSPICRPATRRPPTVTPRHARERVERRLRATSSPSAEAWSCAVTSPAPRRRSASAIPGSAASSRSTRVRLGRRLDEQHEARARDRGPWRPGCARPRPRSRRREGRSRPELSSAPASGPPITPARTTNRSDEEERCGGDVRQACRRSSAPARRRTSAPGRQSAADAYSRGSTLSSHAGSGPGSDRPERRMGVLRPGPTGRAHATSSPRSSRRRPATPRRSTATARRCGGSASATRRSRTGARPTSPTAARATRSRPAVSPHISPASTGSTGRRPRRPAGSPARGGCSTRAGRVPSAARSRSRRPSAPRTRPTRSATRAPRSRSPTRSGTLPSSARRSRNSVARSCARAASPRDSGCSTRR